MEPEGSSPYTQEPATCPSPNPQAGGPHLVGCLRLLIQNIRSYPPYLEAVPPSATWGRAMPWWQGPTCHGQNFIMLVILKFLKRFPLLFSFFLQFNKYQIFYVKFIYKWWVFINLFYALGDIHVKWTQKLQILW
jgi:hypothetical protein